MFELFELTTPSDKNGYTCACLLFSLLWQRDSYFRELAFCSFIIASVGVRQRSGQGDMNSGRFELTASYSFYFSFPQPCKTPALLPLQNIKKKTIELMFAGVNTFLVRLRLILARAAGEG